MNSAMLIPLGFGPWHPLNLLAEKALLASLPARTGIYAIRCSNPKRNLGPSDLVYFGKATNADGLKRRIRQYFHPGHGNRTNIRIRAEFSSCMDFEVSWIELPVDQAAKIEALLIANYEKGHGALPPWNKRR
jgi:excinuclease UvrABC nuclease subunit